MDFNMSEADLLKLVEDVRSELATIAKKETDKLAKAEGEESPEVSPEEEASVDAPPADAPVDAPPAEGDAPAPAGVSAEDSEAPPPAPAPEGDVPPEAPAADPAEGQEGQAPSFDELVQLYSQQSPEDFEMHMAAIKQAAQMKGGEQAALGAPEASAPAAPPPAQEPAMKSESLKVKELEGKLADMNKSMSEMTQVVENLTKIASAPQRKAVTGFTFVPMRKTEAEKATAKFEEMTKSELMDALKVMSNSPSLKKSDRELINAFVFNQVKREALAPLFNKEQK